MKKIEKVIQKMKEEARAQKAKQAKPGASFSGGITMDYTKPPYGCKPPRQEPKVRDMRQESIDLGSHGAAEYFTNGDV